MGKLRTEPIHKRIMSEHEYQRISHVLHTAFKAAKDNNIYWDLEEGERASAVRKSFLYVAKKENLNISIRRVRGEHSLAIHFLETKAKPTLRIAAEESRRRIIKLLAQARKPLKKSQIIRETQIAASTWNLRIKELVNAGVVERHGDRRDTTYTLAKSPL
ncbi:MAG: hypothetical protein H6510_10860 [Acidobacteria bacterium]|nr:hypothetical protein [Acidobacteriota bacterium]MCB9398310.1 hypothetical protein [Acidobacteriota bacterium]